MRGEELKKKLLIIEISFADISRKLGMTPQHFNQALGVVDVKTGFLERLCETLDLGIDFFYSGTPYLKSGNLAVANGDHSQAANGNIQGDTYGDGNTFYGCKEKPEEFLQNLIESNARLTKELDKSQQQKDELIKIIKNLTSK